MTPAELRELDAWICVNVMGWTGVTRQEAGLFAYPPSETKVQTVRPIPFFTSDKSAALDVLERCIREYGPAGVMGSEETGFEVWDMQEPRKQGIALSLPLAIALFAKALFGKEIV